MLIAEALSNHWTSAECSTLSSVCTDVPLTCGVVFLRSLSGLFSVSPSAAAPDNKWSEVWGGRMKSSDVHRMLAQKSGAMFVELLKSRIAHTGQRWDAYPGCNLERRR